MTTATAQPRIAGVDVARGLAVLAMLQTHAYDGWVRNDARASLGFGITRVIATLALPSFLFLSGVSIALRVQLACGRGEATTQLRIALARRALGIVVIGYAYSAGCSVLDGGAGVDTWLRADVLQAIGASIAVIALLAMPRRGLREEQLSLLRARAIMIGAATWLACPWLTRLGAHVDGPLRHAAAVFIDVPHITRMPVVPLLAWTAAGVAIGSAALQPLRLLTLGVCAMLASACALHILVDRTGLTPARDNLAILPNVTDLLGRALCVLALGLWLAARFGTRVGGLLALGKHSLLVYMLHLPFCYGRLARPFAHALSLPTATLGLAVLTSACLATSALLVDASLLPQRDNRLSRLLRHVRIDTRAR